MEEKSIAIQIREKFGLAEQDIRTYSPLALAYIGDSIYDLVIRTVLVEKGNCQVNKLHRQASALVKAAAQKKILIAIDPELTEEERGYYKRGRNAKSFTSAKNASLSEYRVATGLESLMGFLYLTNQMERILFLIKLGIQRLKEEARKGETRKRVESGMEDETKDEIKKEIEDEIEERENEIENEMKEMENEKMKWKTK